MAKEKTDNSILGYIQIEKIGKRAFVPKLNIEVTSAKKDDVFHVKKPIWTIFKKKEDYLVPLHKSEDYIKNVLRESIKEAIKGSFHHAIRIGQVEKKHELAFYTVKAINTMVGSSIGTLCVYSDYKGKQEDVVYVDNFKVVKEVRHTSLELREAFKKHLPEVYANVKKIASFPMTEMPELFLTKEEEDLMMLIKTKWKSIPVKNVQILHRLQKLIEAHEELATMGKPEK